MMCQSDPFWRRLWMIRVIALSAAALISASLHGLPQATAQQGPKSAVTTGKMRVEVVDTKGKPLPEAKLHASVWTDEEFKANRDYVCDSQGAAEIELPRTLTILRLCATKEGHAGMFANLQGKQNNELVIPEDFTFRLPTGTVMGGVVRDEAGQPIQDARVELRYESGGGKKEDDLIVPSIDGFKLTDSAGRWKFDIVPPGDDVEVRIKLSHPDYISDQYDGEIQRKQNITSPALRAQTAAIVMQRGVAVTGKVTDSEGKPIPGAVVVWGDNPYNQTGSQEVRTDERGAYRFASLPPGPMRVTVVAKGWMPDSRKTTLDPDTQPIDFQLKPGKKLRIRIVDRSGTPVPEVWISIQKWRGAKSLYNTKHSNVLDTKIPLKADCDGIFEWTWAPDDAVTYHFDKEGFARTTASIAADDSEHIQTINHVLRITGSVRDAATGKAIDDFLVVPVIFFRPDFPMLNRRDAQRQKGGRFSMEFDRTDIEHGIQIEASGYMTFRSPGRSRIGDSDPGLKVELQPVGRHIGHVLNPDGKPARGGQVYAATGFQHIDLVNLQDDSGDFTSNYRVNTDDTGAFEIVPQMERYALLVITPDGYAHVERTAGQQPGEVRLQSWAKVTGQLVQSGKPVPNCAVTLFPIRYVGGDEPRIESWFSVKTNSGGSFAFERVPPISCRVSGDLHWSVESPLTSSRSLPLSLAPGQEARLKLGGDGIEVTGQLMAENQPAGFDYHFSLSYLVAQRPGIDPPLSVAGKGFDWRKGWSDSWRNSQEGGAYLDTLHNWFVKPDPDGRFKISGVEPGDYEFAVNLYGTTEGCLVHPIATRLIRFSVASSDTALDLGKLSIPSLSLPKVGDLAGDFEFVALDGSKASLSALRGKHVLIDFWATWCGPCVAKLPEVERLRKEFEAEDRLVVVGANLDADTQRARDFLKANPLPWQHALLGDWSSTDVPRRFGIASVPSYVLIGPDGRIMAHEYSLEGIATKLKSLQGDHPEKR